MIESQIEPKIAGLGHDGFSLRDTEKMIHYHWPFKKITQSLTVKWDN